MTAETRKPFRIVAPRTIIAIGGMTAVAMGLPATAQTTQAAESPSYHVDGEGEGQGLPEYAAEGEGQAAQASEGEGEGEPAVAPEGEGEGDVSGLESDVAFLTGLGFMEGHLRAGLALYGAGDLAAAKTHMGHPIEEKYGAVADRLAALGHDDLRATISALAAAAEAEKPLEEIDALFEEVRETHEDVRAGFSLKDQLASYVALTRIAADEYTVAVAGGTLSNLHEYQDAWGFLRVIETEAAELAEDNDATVAAIAETLLEQVGAMNAAFGDLQGGGSFEKDPAVLYAAAARMELAALSLD